MKSSGFDPGFDFDHYVRDVWSEKLASVSTKKKTVTSKKGKMTAPTTLDDKINKVKKKKLTNGAANGLDESVIEIKEEDEEDEESDSDEESEEEEDESEENSDVIESDNSMSGSSSKKAKAKKLKKKKASEITEDDDIDLSDDELQEDQVVLKGSQKKKKKRKGEQEESEDEGLQEDVARLEDDPEFTFETNMSFQQMNLSRPLLKAITSLGFIHPTPIQAAAIPVALAGRDICGCAATGTGKTAAYMLPVLERLLYKVNNMNFT